MSSPFMFERAHPSSKRCTLHCSSSRCSFHSSPSWVGAGASIGPATPNVAHSFAPVNVRRLGLRDESVHDEFHMPSAILNAENVVVCCIQEPSASAFTTLLVDWICQWDGTAEFRDREAALLFCSGVSCIHHSWRSGHSLDVVAQSPGHHVCMFPLRSPRWAS